MKKILLPALIAALFAAHASAAEREFLFGPSESPSQAAKPEVKKTPARVAAVKKEVIKPVAKAEPATTAVRVVPVIPAVKQVAAAPKAVVPVAVVKQETPTAKPVAPVAVAPAKAASAVAAAPVIKPAPPPAPAPAPAPAAKFAPSAVVAAAPSKIPAAPAPVVAALPAPVVVAAPLTPGLSQNMMDMVSVQRPSAPVFTSEGYKANAVTSYSDAMSERSNLAKKFPYSVTVGFFSSPTGNQDAFSFQTNYLPIANYLSVKSGTLLNLVPERDLGIFRNHISDARYPLVFINAALARDASKAGYIPLAVGAEELAPGFLARADGRFRSLDDLKGAQISYTRNAQTGMLAQSIVAKKGFGKDVKFNDVGSLGYAGALNDLKTKNADIIIVRTNQIDDLVKKSGGEYISIGKGESAPSAGLWVRSDFANSDVVKKIESGILEVSPDAEGPAKFASLMFKRGFGVEGRFVRPEPNFAARLTSILDAAEQSFGSYFSQSLVVNRKALMANMARPALEPHYAINSKDPLFYRQAFVDKMKEGMNVGFLVPSSSAQDIYSFQTNFMPLSNYLSDQTGILISLLPERDGNEYIRRIAANEYPAIVIGPSLAQAALLSGYLPVARAGDFISPGFMVLSKSGILKISDLNGKRLAAVRTSDAATVGRWELLKNGVKEASIEFFGSSKDGASVLDSGAADAVILRSLEAVEMAAKIKGPDGKALFRAIVGVEEVPAVSVWVRHDVYDYPIVQSLADAFRDFSDKGGDLKARAFGGYVRGFLVNDPWQTSGIEEHTSSVEMIDGLNKAKLSLVNEAVINPALIEKNRGRPMTYSLVKSIGYVAGFSEMMAKKGPAAATSAVVATASPAKVTAPVAAAAIKPASAASTPSAKPSTPAVPLVPAAKKN